MRRSFWFEAAHQLPNHPGKCKDLHGHSYQLIVSVDGPIDDHSGLVIDFSDLKKIVHAKVVDRLDHKYVNDLIANPSAERMTVWMWDQLKPELPGLVEIELHETRNCSVLYRGPDE